MCIPLCLSNLAYLCYTRLQVIPVIRYIVYPHPQTHMRTHASKLPPTYAHVLAHSRTDVHTYFEFHILAEIQRTVLTQPTIESPNSLHIQVHKRSQTLSFSLNLPHTECTFSQRSVSRLSSHQFSCSNILLLVCLRTHTHIYTPTSMDLIISTYTHTQTLTFTLAHSDACAHAQTHTHTHTYTHTHTHTHTHTNLD